MAMSPRLLRPRATGFNPASIAGLRAWYDFADAATLGPTSTGVGTVLDNGPVKFVKDKSTAGLNLTQAGADSVAPSFVASSLNGRSALSFDGGDTLEGSSVMMTAPFSIFAVCRSNATGSSRLFGANAARSVGPFAASSSWGFFQADSTIRTFNATATNNTVLAMTCNASLAAVFFGNNSQASTGTIATLTPSSWKLGNDGGSSSFFSGVVFEILNYNSALSASQVSAVSRYLGKKWGITVA